MIDLEVFRKHHPGPVGTIGIVSRDHMNIASVMSLLHLRLPLPGVEWIFNVGSILPLQRNYVVQHMRGDWLLFIDDDMVFGPDTLLRLLQTREDLIAQGVEPDILGALCFRRSPPHQPTLLLREHPDSGPYRPMTDYLDKEVVEVDATGMAFAIVSRSAFERIAGMEMPSYEDRTSGSAPAEFFRWHGNVGEDIRFCSDLKSRGGHIYVDTRVKTRHVSEHQVGEADWRRHLGTQ